MAVQMNINYEQLVDLVEQLSEEQQSKLIDHILDERKRKRPLTAREKIQLLRAAQIDVEVLEEPSIRREDWYGDDGR